MSRFRKEYRPLSDQEKVLVDQIKDKAEELAQLLDRAGDRHETGRSRYLSLARTALEEAVMWAVKDVTG